MPGPKANSIRLGWLRQLKQIPAVAVKILKHHHFAIRLLPGFSSELDPAGFHCLIITSEIVGVEKEGNAATGLIADSALLLWRRSFSEEEACALAAAGPNQYPTFCFG